MPLGRALRAAPRVAFRGVVPRYPRVGASAPPPEGDERTWDQASGNEGYRIVWSNTSHASASGSIQEIEALYAPNVADTATNVNSYSIPGSGTIYWRVAVLVSGYPQQWSDEASFSA